MRGAGTVEQLRIEAAKAEPIREDFYRRVIEENGGATKR
jgi:hypothetical protein